MDPKELKRIFERGNCLSLDTMRLYNEGKLPSKSAHQVEEHLIECSLCASAIDGLSKTRINDVTKVSSNIHKRLAVYMNTPPHTPILSRFGVAMIVSSLVVAIGLTTWFLTRDTEIQNKELVDSGAVTQYQPPSKEPNTQVISEPSSVERSQENGAVSVQDNGERPTNASEPREVVIENLPATQPGDKSVATLTVTPEEQPKNQPPVPEENTRVAQTDQFLRIKSVTIYPPTTHTDKKAKSNDGGGNGQLDRSKKSNAEFELSEMPSYPGGNEALKAYILNNYKAQKEDKDNLKRKTTGILFQVNAKTGEISGVSLSFAISPATDAELLRVINAMPLWNPGTKRGTVDVMIGITFE
jgi:hypothetical protein